MWNNQGNGNGYGAGPSDVYDRLNNARQISNRDPYIEEGNHTLAVISIEEFNSQDQGVAVRATFEVLESSVMRPGTKCGTVWFLQKPSPKPGMVTDSDRFADFCIRLKGAAPGYPIGGDIRTLLKDRAAEQLARGNVIRAFGVKKVAKSTGKAFVVINWDHVEQSDQQIAQMRQRIESTPGLVDAPRGTQGGQFQGAPHPAQQGPYGQAQPMQGPPQTQAWGQQPAPQQGPGPVQNSGAPQGWGGVSGIGNGNGGGRQW